MIQAIQEVGDRSGKSGGAGPDNEEKKSDSIVQESHKQVVDYLQKRVKDEPFGGLSVDLSSPPEQKLKQESDVPVATEKDDTMLSGSKRLRLEAFNAVKKGEIANCVEFAFL